MEGTRRDDPWYEGDEVEQGDLLTDCPVFLPPDDLPMRLTPDAMIGAEFDWQTRDLVVTSPSCDSQGFARYFMRVGLPVDIPPLA
jgi:hypothetical protein